MADAIRETIAGFGYDARALRRSALSAAIGSLAGVRERCPVGSASLKPDEWRGSWHVRDDREGPRRRLTAAAAPEGGTPMTEGRPRPTVLLVIDGFGIAAASDDTIATASMPRWRALRDRWPHTTLDASGPAVGLPEGQMGNSEVGHLTGRWPAGPPDYPASRRHHDCSFYARPHWSTRWVAAQRTPAACPDAGPWWGPCLRPPRDRSRAAAQHGVTDLVFTCSSTVVTSPDRGRLPG
jgi:hypothetical protein